MVRDPGHSSSGSDEERPQHSFGHANTEHTRSHLPFQHHHSRTARRPTVAEIASPLAFGEVDSYHQLPIVDRLAKHWTRFLWTCLFTCAYYLTIGGNNTEQALMSGEMKEVLEEFFADAGKTGERITEGEVTPGFKEVLHGDDVGKTLTWFQMFCMNKAGSDDHVPWAWSCKIAQVKIGETHPVPWNIIDNKYLEKNDQSAEDSKELQQYICSHHFLAEHVVFGTDPRVVPFGDIKKFRLMINSTHNLLKGQRPLDSFELAEEFDEYTVLDGNPTKEIIQDAMEEVEAEEEANRLRRRRRLESAFPNLASGRVGSKPPHWKPRIRPKRLALARSPRRPRSPRFPRAPPLNPDGDGSVTPPPGLFDKDDSVELPSWCFKKYASELRVLMRNIQLFDMDRDNALDKNETRNLVFNMNIKNETFVDQLWDVIDRDHNGEASYEELIDFFRSQKQVFKNVDTFLDTVCRNHHWGMLPICGPEYISVNFHIENRNADTTNGTRAGTMYRNAMADVTIKFQQVGYNKGDSRDASTGWYKASIETRSRDFYNPISWWQVFWGFVTLCLFIPLFLVDAVWTTVRLPLSMYNLVKRENRKVVTKLSEVHHLVMYLIDGRHARCHFMGTLMIMHENLSALIFVFACLHSLYRATRPSVPMIGEFPNARCEDLYDDQIMKYVKSYFMFNRTLTDTSAEDYSRLISPIEFITTCSYDSENFVDVLPEVFFCGFFDANGSHAVCLFAFLFRLLDICQAFESTAWLPRTVELASRKLIFFLMFYFWVVFSFALLMSLSFGMIFVQYQNLSRAMQVLLLFSFGLTDYALDGVHTFEEGRSAWVTFYLVSFTVIVVSVAMQFFTTIIMDAYATLQDPEHYIEAQVDESCAWLNTISVFLFPRAVFDDARFRKQAKAKISGYAVSLVWMEKAAAGLVDGRMTKRQLQRLSELSGDRRGVKSTGTFRSSGFGVGAGSRSRSLQRAVAKALPGSSSPTRSRYSSTSRHTKDSSSDDDGHGVELATLRESRPASSLNNKDN